MKMSPFTYASGLTPPEYACGCCGATGVRLYRLYQTFLEQQELKCRACTLEAGNKVSQHTSALEHNIGSMVAAVPLEDGSTFWGYTSVPQAGVIWWDNLPKTK